MKETVREFLRRGLVACGFGPLVLAALYGIVYLGSGVEVVEVREVCLGIVSLSALAFVAGGMNVLYRIERLPLMTAVLIHGSVLYVGYLATYLINGWLEWGSAPILIFSVIFLLIYLGIWGTIYFLTKRRTARLNEILQEKQRRETLGE